MTVSRSTMRTPSPCPEPGDRQASAGVMGPATTRAIQRFVGNPAVPSADISPAVQRIGANRRSRRRPGDL